MMPNCDVGTNVTVMANGMKLCCDTRGYDDNGNCPYLRLIDIGHVDVPVCIFEGNDDEN